MGLIKAAKASIGGVLADQWREFFTCDSIPSDILMVRGYKKTGPNSSNKGSDNVISNGSVVAVADGQCMMIVDNGRVVEICAEPGEFTFDTSTESSILSSMFLGGFGDAIKNTAKNMAERFTFGGDVPKDMRVYYINTKEIVGNKYGTPSPIPFRVVDQEIGIRLQTAIRCSGEYTYRITNPVMFYGLAGNVTNDYNRGTIDSTMKSELISALRPAFAKVAALGILPSDLPLHEKEIREKLNEELSIEWGERRGIEVVSFTIPNATIPPEDMAKIQEAELKYQEFFQRKMERSSLTDPNMAAAALVASQANAMETAAGNSAGAMMGFMGMNQAMQAGGGAMNAQNLFQMGQQQQMQQQQQAQQQAQEQAAQQAAATAAGAWSCSCGQSNTGRFCAECGGAKPEPAGQWVCSCGNANTGKFCAECGGAKPAAPPSNDWTCRCGVTNTGRFCAECGTPKDAPAPVAPAPAPIPPAPPPPPAAIVMPAPVAAPPEFMPEPAPVVPDFAPPEFPPMGNSL